MGVAGPDDAAMCGTERRQRTDQLRGRLVEVEQRILEEEPEVHRDLVVPRAAGVQPLTRVSIPPGEPRFDRGMHILLARLDGELATVHRLERGAQPGAKRPMPRFTQQA